MISLLRFRRRIFTPGFAAANALESTCKREEDHFFTGK